MTDRYAVIGNPIAQSKSPLIHALFAQATGQDIEYGRIEGPLDGFAGAVRAFRDDGGRGLNVTAPFKLQAFEIATDRLPRAQWAGASNALKFEGGRAWADNFDGEGLVIDIQRNLGVAMAGARVLMLGAGGAARGTLLPFLNCQLETLVIANRSAHKAQLLAAEFSPHGPVRGCGFEALADERFDVVINATSASLIGDASALSQGALPKSALAHATLVYEMAYGKGLTPFLRAAREAGAQRVADGVGMLIEQAALSFEWWRGVRPDTRAAIAKFTVPLLSPDTAVDRSLAPQTTP